MNIVLIDVMPELETCFRELGHTVTVFRPGGGVFHLPWMLAKNGVTPDFVLQQEGLGVRNYLGGLDRLPCPSAFWAIDSHLNLFWHAWYARLFDLVLTPHVSLFASLPEICRPMRILRFTWPGERRAFVPHARRGHALGLCARVTAHRPIRTWMVDLLKPRNRVFKDDLSHERMMAFYDDTCVVPNECIANEVNFRLMEGASSGSLVLSPDVGEDQNAVLEPGKEFLIYRDGLELLDLAAWAAARPAAAEAIGFAALRRMQAEHLPEHRVAGLLRECSVLSLNRLEGTAASLAFWLVLALQIRNGVLGLDAGEHAREGRKLVRALLDSARPTAEESVLAGRVMAQVFLTLAEEPAERDGALRLFGEILEALRRSAGRNGNPDYKDVPLLGGDVLAAASAFALKEQRLDTAMMFRLYYGAGGGKLPGAGVAELCASWSGVRGKEGRAFTPGFRFDPAKGRLPEDAFGWLLFGLHLEPEADVLYSSRFDALLENRPQFLFLSVGYLAEHCLAKPGNWRAQLDFGLACLKACRVEEGLHEVREAREKAFAEVRERLFWGRLNAWRPGGRVWEDLL